MATPEESRSDGGHGGIYALLIVIVMLMIAAFFIFGGLDRQEDPGIDVDIEVPLEGGGEGGGGEGGGGEPPPGD